jgi:hypothetical protein
VSEHTEVGEVASGKLDAGDVRNDPVPSKNRNDSRKRELSRWLFHNETGDNSVLPSNDSQIAMEQGIMVAEVNVAIGL